MEFSQSPNSSGLIPPVLNFYIKLVLGLIFSSKLSSLNISFYFASDTPYLPILYSFTLIGALDLTSGFHALQVLLFAFHIVFSRLCLFF